VTAATGRRTWLRWSLAAAAAPAMAGPGRAALVWRERALHGFGTTLWDQDLFNKMAKRGADHSSNRDKHNTNSDYSVCKK
jgi:hypothetical protein